MKFNITLNLLKMQEHNLNVNQWCILDIISVAPAWCEIVMYRETPYFWISRTKILEELKALDLKEDTIYRHLKTLKELGFIEYEKDHKKDLIKLTELGKSLFINSEINPTKLGNKSENNSEINPTYNNTSIYNNTRDKEKDKKENLAEQFIKEKNVTQQSNKDLVIDFVEYRKLIKKPLRTIAPIQQLIDNLILLKDLGYSFDYCIEQMKSNEWQTVKKDYIHKAKPQQSFKKSNTDGNAEFIRQHYGINEDGNIIDTEII